jgi:hypothetical protein
MVMMRLTAQHRSNANRHFFCRGFPNELKKLGRVILCGTRYFLRLEKTSNSLVVRFEI